MPLSGHIVVLGAGQAGYWLVKTLREQDYKGPVTLIGDEPDPPYDRPPLSKQVLIGEAEPQSTWYATPDELAALAVEFQAGIRATAIDRERRIVTTSAGAEVAYDRLVIATGARARRLNLPGEETAPVFYLRSMKDCLTLREVMTERRRITVVGGGLIGLEVAAAGVACGCAVTVVEAAERVMARVVGPEISRFYETLHRDRGAAIATGRMPQSITTDGTGCAIEFADGTAIAGDAIVAGIGAVPDDAIARDAGLATERHFDDGVTRYEIEHEHHDHLVCTRCGKIIEFECQMIEATQEKIAAKYGFRVLRHRHELYGHCKDCRDD